MDELRDAIASWLAEAPTDVVRLVFETSEGRWVKLEVRQQEMLLTPDEFSRRYLMPMFAAVRERVVES